MLLILIRITRILFLLSMKLKSNDRERNGRINTYKNVLPPPQTSGITATSEMVWVKEEPLERESVSSGDVSFDSLSHDDSSRGSWFTERDLLKPNNRPPQALFDSDEDDDMTLQVSGWGWVAFIYLFFSCLYLNICEMYFCY